MPRTFPIFNSLIRAERRLNEEYRKMLTFASQGKRSNAIPSATLPREMMAYLLVVAGLWGLSLLNALLRLRTRSFPDAFAYLFLINPEFDLLCYVDRFHLLHHAGFYDLPSYPWNYPAPCALIYRFFYRFAIHNKPLIIVTAFIVTVLLLLLVSGFLLGRAMARRGLGPKRAALFLAASAVLSWPIYFAVQRGNIEAVLWVGLAAALAAYVRRQWMLAAVLLGIVTAFKLYPILCFALFLKPRRYREMAAGLLSAAGITAISLLYLGPTLQVAARNTVFGIKRFLKLYSLLYDPLVIGYDHSAFSLVKVLSVSHQEAIPAYLSHYTLIAGAVATLLFFGRVWRMPRPNQLMMVCAVVVLLPSTSFDYTLQSLYIPWAWMLLLLLSAHRSGKRIPGAMAAMICLAILLGPETFLRHGGVLFAGQIKALTLLALIAISMWFRFEEEKAQISLEV